MRAEEIKLAMPRGKAGGKGHKVANEQERKIRGSMMLAQKLLGKTNQELVEMFGVSHTTVEKSLSLARKQNLYGAVENMMVENLIPKAMFTYDNHLNENDVECARDILYGTGILRKSPAVQVGGDSEMTIDMIRTRIFNRSLPKEPSDGPKLSAFSSQNPLEQPIEATIVPPEETTEGDSERVRQELLEGEEG